MEMKIMFDFLGMFGNNKNDNLRKLMEIVRKAVNSAETFEDVLERGGLRRLFEKQLPKQVAADLCNIIRRIGAYPYASGAERRSSRSTNPADYYDKIYYVAQDIFAVWKDYDLITSIKAGDNKRWQGEYKFCGFTTEEMLLALKIDQGDKRIIADVTDMLLSDNNATAISYSLIRGVAMCHNKELHEIMKNLLLAAKLQEGLRQAILQSADDGTLDFFRLIMNTVAENDLLRFSSAVRAVGVWMGLGYDYGDKRTVEKLLKLGITYLDNASERNTAFESADVIEMYVAMWAEAVFSIHYLYSRIEKYRVYGKPYQKLVVAYFIMDTNHFWLASATLNERNLDLLALTR